MPFFSVLFDFDSQVLVLGLCFLAGGMRFSEQGFDASKPGSLPPAFSIVFTPTCSCYSGALIAAQHQCWRRVITSCVSLRPQ